MHVQVRWQTANGPGFGYLTTEELPPNCDRELPVVVMDDGRCLGPSDLAGISLSALSPIAPDEMRLAQQTGYSFR